MEREGAFAFARAEANVKAAEVFGGGENLWIGAWAAAEVDDMAGEIAAELRCIGVVAVEESDTIFRQRRR